MVPIKRRGRGSVAEPPKASTWVTQPAKIAGAKKLVPRGIRARRLCSRNDYRCARKTILNDLEISYCEHVDFFNIYLKLKC